MKIIKNQRGYIALIATIIILAITLAIGLSLNMLSIGETQAGSLTEATAQSFAAADTCLQEGYLRLHRSSAYTGGSLAIGGGSCTIEVVRQGSQYLITAVSDIQGASRHLQGTVRLSGNRLQQDGWQELY